MFGSGDGGGFDGNGGSGCASASGGEDGVVAEHRYEHDDVTAASTGCSGEATGDGTTSAGGGAEDDRDAIVRDAGDVAEVICGYATEQELPVYECPSERDGNVGRYGLHDG